MEPLNCYKKPANPPSDHLFLSQIQHTLLELLTIYNLTNYNLPTKETNTIKVARPTEEQATTDFKSRNSSNVQESQI